MKLYSLNRSEDPPPPECDCENCPLKSYNNRWVAPKSSSLKTPKLIIVSERPGRDEAAYNEPLIGESGRLLNKILNKYHIKSYEVYKTNVLLCHVPKKLTPAATKQAIICCRERLHKELNVIDPHGKTLILALGGLALQSLCKKQGMHNWCGYFVAGTSYAVKTKRTKKIYHPGELVSFKKWKIIPTFHPAFCLPYRSPAYTTVLARHIQWAINYTRTKKDWEWPHEVININDEAVATLESILQTKDDIGFDIETIGTDPLHNKIMCLAIANKNHSVCVNWEAYSSKRAGFVRSIDDFGAIGKYTKSLIKNILEDQDIFKIMQNGNHDTTGMKARSNINFGASYTFDTLIAHAIIAPKLLHRLGFLAACEFFLPQWKALFKVTTDAKGLEAFVNRPQEELRIYCARDAYVTRILKEPLLKQLLARPELYEVFKTKMNTMYIAGRMHKWGFSVNKTEIKKHKIHLDKKLTYTLKRLKKYALEAYKQSLRSAAPLPHKYINYTQFYTYVHSKKGLTKKVEIKRHAILKDQTPLFKKYIKSFIKYTIKNYNPNAKWQEQFLFFDLLNAPILEYSEATNLPTVNRDVLNQLLLQDDPIGGVAQYTLEYHRWSKLLSSYINKLYGELDKNNICHPTWKVWGARTGRWSCS